MTAFSATVCDAVVDELNAQTAQWGLSCTAARQYRANWTSIELSTTRMAVLLGPFAYADLDRSRDLITVSSDILVAKRINPDVNEQADALVEALEKIGAWFRRKTLVTVEGKSISCVERRYIGADETMIDDRMLADHRAACLALRLNWIPLARV